MSLAQERGQQFQGTSDGSDERYSFITPKQRGTIKLIERFATKMLTENPGLEDFYRSDSHISFIGVAERYIPSVLEINPRLAEAVVSWSLHKLIPPEELKELVKIRQKNHKLHLKKSGFYSTDEHRERTVLGGKQKAINLGHIPWAEEEKKLVLGLIENPDYQHTSGRNKGRPNFKKISAELNIRFHQGANIRTPLATGHNYRDWRA